MLRGLCSLAQVANPVALIHGPFGSGKSTLLVSIIRFLLQQVHVTPFMFPSGIFVNVPHHRMPGR
jgi:DNA replication protein DnaC